MNCKLRTIDFGKEKFDGGGKSLGPIFFLVSASRLYYEEDFRRKKVWEHFSMGLRHSWVQHRIRVRNVFVSTAIAWSIDANHDYRFDRAVRYKLGQRLVYK